MYSVRLCNNEYEYKKNRKAYSELTFLIFKRNTTRNEIRKYYKTK